MLTRVTLDHFKSFKEKTTIDLRKTNYTILPQNVSDTGVLKGCVFVGANASGKSNIILSVKLLLDLLFGENSVSAPAYLCMFDTRPFYSVEYEFSIDGHEIRYKIGVNVLKESIEEQLYVDDIHLMERLGQAAKSYIAEEEGIMYTSDSVGKEGLFLRTLYFNTRFASNKTLVHWMEYLKNSVYINIFAKTKVQVYNNTDLSLVSYLNQNGCDTINRFFKEYHFHQQIEYAHSSEGRNITVTTGKEEADKTVFFRREGVEVPIPFFLESFGNQNLISVLPAFLNAIAKDGILLIDEFSSGFHNELESLLIRYFMKNSRHSQMIFVSHSTNILSNSILRPDQEYAVEFVAGTGSTVNRFSSEQPRSAQNIEKMYVSGVFGGLPNYSEEYQDESES